MANCTPDVKYIMKAIQYKFLFLVLCLMWSNCLV